MKFTDLFIKRPVLALVVNLVILIAGVQAYRTLNVRQYPQSENATVTVTTVYVGASAELVRGFITTPLERSIAAADGIDYLASTSVQGISTISARLKLNYDPIKALAEISSKVDQVRNNLPAEAQVPSIDVQSADSQFASAYLSFTSETLRQNEITDYLVRVVQPRLSAIPGVQRADILGARTFAMRVWLKPDRMAAFNVSPSQVSAALAANNHLSALGNTKGNLIQVALTANTDLRSVEEFKNLVVRQQNNAIVRIRDIADVELGAEDYDTDVKLSGETAVFMGVFVLPNANSLDVIRLVRNEMDSIKRELPGGMQAGVAYDATAYINDAIHEVFHTLGDTLLIVVVVIFLFLGSFRSVLIPIVAIPLSLVGAVFLMQAVRIHDQPADAPRDRALGGARRRRRDRRRRERGAPPRRGPGAPPGRAYRRPRAHRADHRHDGHARRRLRADRAPGGPHRLPLPRIRVHARRGGHDLRARRADALADDVLDVPEGGGRGAGLCRHGDAHL